jgi:hypothetical protein
VAAKIPHKVPISATKYKFSGGINLPLNHMPVNLLAEISANKFVKSIKLTTHTLCGRKFRQELIWQIPTLCGGIFRQ